ncbi:MAG: SRPBCC family protein [Actinobacteria bacterium]|nr:SRPBCC family protein [Actinomycetota bacterium]
MARIAVQRSFDVAVSPEAAWTRLAEVERWPEWAPHIKSVVVSPTGPLGPSSAGAVQIRGFGRNSFRMSVWKPHDRWEWTGGGIPGVQIRYDHRFEAGPDDTTKMTWVVTLDGPMAWLIRPIFGRIYGRNLDRALPRLLEWMHPGHAERD